MLGTKQLENPEVNISVWNHPLVTCLVRTSLYSKRLAYRELRKVRVLYGELVLEHPLPISWLKVTGIFIGDKIFNTRCTAATGKRTQVTQLCNSPSHTLASNLSYSNLINQQIYSYCLRKLKFCTPKKKSNISSRQTRNTNNKCVGLMTTKVTKVIRSEFAKSIIFVKDI